MKVRIGRRRSNADVRHSRAHTPESLAVAPAFKIIDPKTKHPASEE